MLIKVHIIDAEAFMDDQLGFLFGKFATNQNVNAGTHEKKEEPSKKGFLYS